MKYLVLLLAALTLLASAHAEDLPANPVPPSAFSVVEPAVESPESEPLAALPQHLGYAITQPTMLLRQRLFGLAHGLSLLAAACLDLPEQAIAVENAYAAWHEKQADTIQMLVRDLAEYHFGPRRDEAQWADIARVLKLKNSIQPALNGVALSEACRTLPEAVTRPRFELGKLLTNPDDSALAVVPTTTFESRTH